MQDLVCRALPEEVDGRAKVLKGFRIQRIYKEIIRIELKEYGIGIPKPSPKCSPLPPSIFGRTNFCMPFAISFLKIVNFIELT